MIEGAQYELCTLVLERNGSHHDEGIELPGFSKAAKFLPGTLLGRLCSRRAWQWTKSPLVRPVAPTNKITVVLRCLIDKRFVLEKDWAAVQQKPGQ